MIFDYSEAWRERILLIKFHHRWAGPLTSFRFSNRYKRRKRRKIRPTNFSFYRLDYIERVEGRVSRCGETVPHRCFLPIALYKNVGTHLYCSAVAMYEYFHVLLNTYTYTRNIVIGT